MNAYDARHLRLLNLIEARQWNEISQDDAEELRVLIVCKYVALAEAAGKAPSMVLNPEGQHYHQRLAELALQQAANIA
ncbi:MULTISPECIES: hypothetical protein [Pseudomonas]|uniref:Flagellar protein FliT n=1 Tax=Pseudomonas quercus TaxID=2722792 RepID=A0ABX0YIZ6_9PSED|nr:MULTISPECIES: hypothetical protein [Pseudomonas]MBF7143043.1 hypothetical protein [Pseudomonas sp. LY10J]NJP01928.1 hypothetical protein [Pseudomonas quercus]